MLKVEILFSFIIRVNVKFVLKEEITVLNAAMVSIEITDQDQI